MSFDYAEYKEPTSGDLLSRISVLALQQMAAEKAVDAAEKALEERKAALRNISEVLLPALMDEAQMSDFTTVDGLKVTVNETVRANIPVAKQSEAFAWLQAHDHADLIKREVKIDFDRGQEEASQAVLAFLKESQPDLRYDLKRSVNPATLSAFVRERLKAGDVIPMETFGVFRQKASKIKAPKD